MARKGLLYYIFSKNKLPLYEDDNGFIFEADGDYKKPDGQPAHLLFSPDGWKDVNVKYARNIKWWGVFRDMAVAMKFPKDGAAILRYLRWTFGMEYPATLGIMKFNRTVTPYRYDKWYASEINFAKTKDTLAYFNVEALEGGLIKFLKAYETTKYEIPIATDPDRQNVLMDGMEFDFNRIFGVEPEEQVTGAGGPYILGMFELTHEGQTTNILWQDNFFQQSVPYPNEFWTMDNLIARDIQAIKGTITIQYDKEVNAIVRAEVDDGHGSGLLIANQYILISETHPAGTTVDIPFNVPVSLAAGERVHFKVFGGASDDSETQFTVKGGRVEFDFVYRHPPTVIQGLYPYHLLKRIINLMTNGAYDVKATDWLFNKKDIIITSGDGLRNLEGAVIKVSLADFFKSMDAAFSVYLTIENSTQYLIVDEIKNAFKSNVIVDLPEVVDAELSEAEDLLGNTISAGYDKQDYTDVNGKYEFNQGQAWITSNTRVIKDLDFKSTFRADPLGIELLRINFDQKLTTDSSSDNDTFFLNVETNQTASIGGPGVNGYLLYRPPYTAFSGLPHWETSFNTELSPHKNLLRNGSYLHSIFDFQDDKVIHLSSKDKNADLITTLAGITVVEAGDIGIGDLPAKLFRPNYFTFTTKVPINLLEIMDADPFGKVKFRWNNHDWFGYLMDGGIEPATYDKQTWKLLSAPENNFLLFNKQNQ